MPSLDQHGQLAAATIAFYSPLLFIVLFLAFRHGFSRGAGWIFLLSFINIRIVGGAILIAAQLTTPVNTSLYTAAYVIESVGLSPLLLATIAFLGVAGQNTLTDDLRMKQLLRILHVIAIIAAVLSIVGGTDSSSTLRHAGIILFLALYILLVLVHGWFWLNSSQIMFHRRTVLKGISAALPFLGIRVIYSILSVYSSNGFSTAEPAHGSLAKFNLITGSWAIYLVMSLIMEYIVVVTYILVGTMIPLQTDYVERDGRGSEDHELKYAPAV